MNQPTIDRGGGHARDIDPWRRADAVECALVNVAIGLLQGTGRLSVWLVRRPLHMILRYSWALVTLAPRLAWASGKLVLGLVVPRRKAKGAT